MKYIKKTIILTGFLAGFVLVLSRCMNNQLEVGKDPRGNVYAGSATCRQCHQAIYDSFLTTAHFKATSAATAENIHGNFKTGNNIFSYDSATKVVMEYRDSGYYQVLYINGKEKMAHRFDILFGYRNAQTSLSWQNDKLFELPVSWFNSIKGWATSPGYPADHPKFDRLVNTECLDCHSSGINIKTTTQVGGDQLFDKNTLVYGIDCERCHGPAINHANYHLANPGLKTAAYLVKNNMLNRGQKLDACAVCHSGNDKMKIESRFQFKMGDTLAYFIMANSGNSNNIIDVHGNQASLLFQSKCFKQTIMTCGTCHDPHKNASADLSIYSQKCMSCHQPGTNNFCTEYAKLGESIKSNCIDCHMPRTASKAISFQEQGSAVLSPYLLRTHRMAVYRAAGNEP